MRRILTIATAFALAGCTPNSALIGMPVATQTTRNPTTFYAVMQPLCIIFCSNPVSTIREDLLATGTTGSVAGGSHSSSQTTTSQPNISGSGG